MRYCIVITKVILFNFNKILNSPAVRLSFDSRMEKELEKDDICQREVKTILG